MGDEGNASLKNPTSPAPPNITYEERAEYRAKVEYKRLRGNRRWRTTGQFDVPGWVLGEMLIDGAIEHRKRSGSSPNEWR